VVSADSAIVCRRSCTKAPALQRISQREAWPAASPETTPSCDCTCSRYMDMDLARDHDPIGTSPYTIRTVFGECGTDQAPHQMIGERHDSVAWNVLTKTGYETGGGRELSHPRRRRRVFVQARLIWSMSDKAMGSGMERVPIKGIHTPVHPSPYLQLGPRNGCTS
jgi:hypothetical protein